MATAKQGPGPLEAKKATDFLTDEFVMNVMFPMFTGDLLTEDLDKIMEVRETFKIVLDGVKNVSSTFDEKVREFRAVNGADTLPGVDLRKPVVRTKGEKSTKEISPDDMFASKK